MTNGIDNIKDEQTKRLIDRLIRAIADLETAVPSKKKTVHRRWQVWVPVAILLGLAGLFVLIERHMSLPTFPTVLEDGAMNDAQEARLQTSLDITKLFFGIGVSIIGAVGLFLKGTLEQSREFDLTSALAGSAAILFAMMSVFFGHMYYNFVLVMLSHDAYPDRTNYDFWQYLFFLASLIALGAFVGNTIYGSYRKKND